MRKLLARDDSAVSEVVGFILAFAISAILLVVSVSAFTRARETTESVVTGVELRGIANRVATRIAQAGVVAQELPNATITFRIPVERDLAGTPYHATAYSTNVTAYTNGELLEGNATLYKLHVVPNLRIGGVAESSTGWMEITYSYTRNVSSTTMTYPDQREYHFKLISIATG